MKSSRELRVTSLERAKQLRDYGQARGRPLPATRRSQLPFSYIALKTKLICFDSLAPSVTVCRDVPSVSCHALMV